MRYLAKVGHGHHHHHGHHHGPAGADPRRALTLALILNAGFLVIEAGVGWWTGSLALLSDATHMLSDVGALVLALAAAQLATRGPSAQMTFGLARAEILGAFLNALVLLVACVAIVAEAVDRLTQGAPAVEGWPVLAVGGVGLVINLASMLALLRSDQDNLNIRGAMVHMAADALGSVGAMVAAALILAGIPAADAVVSLFVVLLVGYGAVVLLRDAGRILLQLPPRSLDVGEVRDALATVPGVAAVHDLHAWSLDGHHPIVSAHLVLDGEAAFEAVCPAATRMLEHRFHIEHATLQPERAPGCGVTGCGVA